MEIKQNTGHFLTEFLGEAATAIPKGAQWLIAFLDLESKILPAINISYKREPNPWKIRKDHTNAILNKSFQGERGCFFAQAVSIPGESIQTNAGGNIQHNALIRPRVGAGRNEYGEMRITFLETNISFVDAFLRGWALATANFGMIARQSNDPRQYRTQMICSKFAIDSVSPYITQQIIFDGICCTSVSDEEYNYTPLTGQPMLREARFVYNSYHVDTESHTKIASAVAPSKAPKKANGSFIKGPENISDRVKAAGPNKLTK